MSGIKRHAGMALTCGDSTARHKPPPPIKNSPPLLKQVSQVRILPGHQGRGPGPIMVWGLWQLDEEAPWGVAGCDCAAAPGNGSRGRHMPQPWRKTSVSA
jgi:hypothetical protein